MMKNISYKIRLTLACVLLSATSVQLIAQTNNDILKQADRHYQYANNARAVQQNEQVVAQTKLLQLLLKAMVFLGMQMKSMVL